ncbi:hypothetical protein [Pseudomonas sp. R151218B TE3479]
MKRTALAGLFISAAMLASPVFAADLCETNLSKIRNDIVSTQQLSEDLKVDLNTTVTQAEEAHKRGTEEGKEECISLTTQALQKLQNNTKGDPQ